MNELLNLMRTRRDYIQLCKRLSDNRGKKLPSLVTGMCDGERALFVAALTGDRPIKGQPVLAILPNEKEISRLAASLGNFGLRTKIYPMRDFVLTNMSASHEFEYERISVLGEIIDNSCDIVLATPDAAVQYTMPADVLVSRTFTLDKSSPISTEKVISTLIDCGYVRVPMVDSQGQFSQRGDILDIFPPTTDDPVRVESFGDEIDRISSFDVMTQRRVDELDRVTISPVREVIPDEDAKKTLEQAIRAKLKKYRSNAEVSDSYARELEDITSGRELLSIDKYISLIYPQKQCLLDYFDDNACVLLQDYNGTADRIHSYEFTENEMLLKLIETGLCDAVYSTHFAGENFFLDYIRSRRTVIMNTFAVSLGGMPLSEIYSLPSRPTSGYADNPSLLFEELDGFLGGGYTVRILCDGDQGAENLRRELSDHGYSPSITETEAKIRLIVAPDLSGFEIDSAKFAVLSVCRGRVGAVKKNKAAVRVGSKKKTNAEKILSYTELAEGDYVVHAVHGVGLFCGVESLDVGGGRRDFVKVKYAGDDLLYIPCNQLDSLSKYVGAAEGVSVKLSRMGTPDWAKTSAKVKAATREMAKELIGLYAARMRKSGFAFEKDDAMDREFADTFEYDETAGQLEAIADIKRDMESSHPMDRLLCGDVGYGKTEVALRAAFKAVQSNKQVAILVPTTILALQHFQTITSRMRGFPISVDMVSRFRTPKQQALTLRRLDRGEVDIIVGTHRLLSKDVKFHDLGLVIIDEEQRFGVAQKEKLKTLTENVDVLTLTATPIPRTMNMALSGIRDMSVLEEAPGDRLPVQSYVTEYNDQLINEAIRRELRRGGQVFYLCNRIERFDRIIARLSEALPDARIGVGHGQMDKEELSDVWHSMINGDIDILVCTTIIETGVDVPNANTLIIEDADKMGLSQLHQIRGRVGRSSRRAYAYFTYPNGKVLTEVAEKRLEAIRDFTEFGAGFRIAIRDLEIRGAGNLLGADQHGHLMSVGYDMYMKLLNEAILEEKGEKVEKRSECNVDLGIDAYIPEKYIDNPNGRIEAYKKISLIRTYEDLYDVTDELIDRYGDTPKPVTNLLKIALIRSLGSECAVTKIVAKDRSTVLYPENFNIQPWSKVSAKNSGRILVSLGQTPTVTLKTPQGIMPAEFALKVLGDYASALKEKDDQ